MVKKIVRGSLRKHLFLLALRLLRRSPRETSPTAKSEEKRMFPQAQYQGRRWAESYLLSVAEL